MLSAHQPLPWGTAQKRGKCRSKPYTCSSTEMTAGVNTIIFKAQCRHCTSASKVCCLGITPNTSHLFTAPSLKYVSNQISLRTSPEEQNSPCENTWKLNAYTRTAVAASCLWCGHGCQKVNLRFNVLNSVPLFHSLSPSHPPTSLLSRLPSLDTKEKPAKEHWNKISSGIFTSQSEIKYPVGIHFWEWNKIPSGIFTSQSGPQRVVQRRERIPISWSHSV